MRRTLAALSLSAALLTAACQNPDGSTDWGNTLLLGAGVGLAGAAVAGAVSDNRDDHRHYRRQQPPPRYYGQGYGRGYGYGRPAYRY